VFTVDHVLGHMIPVHKLTISLRFTLILSSHLRMSSKLPLSIRFLTKILYAFHVQKYLRSFLM
jgi:hypothetical protein